MSIGSKELLLAALLAGLAVAPAAANEAETMYIKAAALSKLAAAVQATVYRGLPDDLSEDTLLYVASRHDPDLLEPFAAYALRARRENRQTSVLLCTADRSLRLVEDAGCTAKLDRHYWRDSEAAACEFAQPLAAICAGH